MSPESYYYIDTKESLAMMCEDLSREDVIGVDLECENNLHHYGAYISLIQISSRNKQWVVDIIALKTIGGLRHILTSRSIQKIFHDVSFDLRILNFEFNCKPKNIFDTQLAALLVGKTEIGLAPLLMEYFSVKKQCKFQMADWSKRPLTAAMLSYAVKDTTYLIPLRDKLVDELSQLNRLEWVKEEFAAIETKRYEKKPYTFKDFKGYSQISDVQRSILKTLFLLREKFAKQVNMPIHFVISNKLLMELVKNPPPLSGWRKLKGTHPIVRRNYLVFYNGVNTAKNKRIVLPVKVYKRYSEDQKKILVKLGDIRDRVSLKVKLARHLIMNKEQLHEIVRTNSFDSLYHWQRKLLEKDLKNLFLDSKTTN